jgi:hypothetical protein
MMHTTNTALAIDSAIRTADGWHTATVRNCARFTTEALVDTAEQSLAGLTTAERTKFASTLCGQFERHDRDWAINALCAYTHAMRLREFGAQFERTLASAKADLPSALEALGAAL